MIEITSFFKRLFRKVLPSPLVLPVPRYESNPERWFGRIDDFKRLGGNVRLWNCLEQNHIVSPLHLSTFTPNELLRLKGFGSATIDQAQVLLSSYGLGLGTNTHDRVRIELAIWPDLQTIDRVYRRSLPPPEFEPIRHPNGRWELCNKDFDAIQKAWMIPETGVTSCPIPIT